MSLRVKRLDVALLKVASVMSLSFTLHVFIVMKFQRFLLNMDRWIFKLLLVHFKRNEMFLMQLGTGFQANYYTILTEMLSYKLVIPGVETQRNPGL